MLKTEHRRVSIDQELAAVRAIAQQLRSPKRCAPAVRSTISQLFQSQLGPTRFIELFNWSHVEAEANQSMIPLRDALYELIRLCARIERYCTAATDHPDDPMDLLDQAATATGWINWLTS